MKIVTSGLVLLTLNLISLNASGAELLNGTNFVFQYAMGENAWSFEVWFNDDEVSYKFIGEEDDRTYTNQGIPYMSRKLGDNWYQIMWHETDVKDVVSLLMNFDAGTIHSAALLGYDGDEPLQHFHSGIIRDMKSLQLAR